MKKTIELSMPIDGKVLPITEVNDYLFNKRVMGDGVALIPKGNFIYSPIDGEIVLIYETKHAIAIKTSDGIQILIHMGLGSAKLEGRGFAAYVKVGDFVKKGDKIMFFDTEFIDKHTSSITPIVITNSEVIENLDINFRAAKAGDSLLSITLK